MSALVWSSSSKLYISWFNLLILSISFAMDQVQLHNFDDLVPVLTEAHIPLQLHATVNQCSTNPLTTIILPTTATPYVNKQKIPLLYRRFNYSLKKTLKSGLRILKCIISITLDQLRNNSCTSYIWRHGSITNMTYTVQRLYKLFCRAATSQIGCTATSPLY